MKPLEGLRVLDFTHILAGPLATQFLGDLGADVIKVERPGSGDDTRSLPPFNHGLGTMFLSVNRNKRSIALDLAKPEGKTIVRRLIETADVLIESFSEGKTLQLGIDPDTARAINPRIIYCSISGYGRSGPLKHLRGYDLVLQAHSGIMDLTGFPGGPATRIPLSPIDQATGHHAFSAILAALLERGRTGRGTLLDCSLFETAISFLGFNLDRYWAEGKMPERTGSGHGSLVPYDVFQTADKPILLGVANDQLWQRLCTVLGDATLLDEKYTKARDRVAHRDELCANVARVLRTRLRAEWLDLFGDNGVPCAPLNTMAEVAEDAHTEARGIFMRYVHPEAGELKSIAWPVRTDEGVRRVRRPPPRLGEHSFEILREMGYDSAQIAALRFSGIVGLPEED